MIARYVHEGKSLDYRPSEAVAAGEVIVLESLVGIARLDIASDTLGSLAVTGVFEVAKASGEISAGVPLYWDAKNKNVTTTAAGNIYIGKAVPHLRMQPFISCLMLPMWQQSLRDEYYGTGCSMA